MAINLRLLRKKRTFLARRKRYRTQAWERRGGMAATPMRKARLRSSVHDGDHPRTVKNVYSQARRTVWVCETRCFADPNGAFRSPKQAVSESKTTCFSKPLCVSRLQRGLRRAAIGKLFLHILGCLTVIAGGAHRWPTASSATAPAYPILKKRTFWGATSRKQK